MNDLLGLRRQSPPADGPTSREVKDWIRTSLALAEGITVMVSELACHEPGCPPVEVVMAVLAPEAPPEQRKIPGRISDLTRQTVEAAWSAPQPQHTHEETL